MTKETRGIYISRGNRKMKIPTFSLPSGITCNPTKLCRKYCYAKKAEKIYKHVLPSRKRNLSISKDSEEFITQVDAVISGRNKRGNKIDYFRIHESGDFYSQEYLNSWIEICNMFPNINFMAYTKRTDLDFSKKPKNMIIYESIWPDSKPNEDWDGLRAYILGSKLPNYPRVIDQDRLTNATICPKELFDTTCDKCLHCFEGKGDVALLLH